MQYESSKNGRLMRERVKITNISRAAQLQREGGHKELSEDSKNRQSIQLCILESIIKTNDEEEILKILNDKFSETKYDTYRPFFRKWIQNKLKDKNRDEGR